MRTWSIKQVIIVDSAVVQSNGTYELSTTATSNYTVVVTTNSLAIELRIPAVALPANWQK